MADLPSILGGMAQGFLDFGKSAVDLFGTGGASIADLIESARTGKVTTKNSDDFRKWLYDTNDVKDAAAKGLGTALNGVQTVSDYIPGIGAVTRNPLFNAGQGALGGLADEFKMYGKDYDLGRAGQRAAVGAGGALASTGLADALKGSGNALLKSGTAQGLARGAVGGAIGAGGYTAIDGGSLGDVANSALQGAGMGAALGGAMGALQDFKPAKTYDVALTDEEKAARIATIDDQLSKLDTSTPEGGARYNELIKARAVYDAPADKIQTLYHQTSADSFADFSPERRSAGVMDQGTPSGIFLKETDADIGLPGKNQLMFDVKMENPYEVDSREALANYARSRSKAYADLYDQAVALDEKAANVYDDFTNELQDKYKRYYYEADEAKKAALKKDVDYLLKNIKKLSDEKAAEYKSQGADVARRAQDELNRVLTQDGYDSVILANDKGSFGRNIKSYIALSPYDQMAEVNAPKALENTLADADMAVNNPKLTPEQEAFFKDSVVRDENGNLKTLYHGSPNGKFTVFDSQYGNPENDWGKGFYFTDNEADVNKNYTGGGPDFDNKVARRAEQLADELNIDYDEAEQQARNEMFKGAYTIDAYANMKDPATVGKTTLFDGTEYRVKPLSDYDNIDDYYTDLIYELTDDVINDTNIDYNYKNDIMAILDEARWNGGIGLQELKDALSNLYIEDYDGRLVSGDVARSIIQNLGYDGIVDPTVSSKFKNMGIDDGTTHYITFEPNQIKNTNNLKPTDNPDVRYSKAAPDELDLGRVLSGQDLSINNAKAAPGQLGLFDDIPTQTPKTGTRQTSLFDQPQEGLDYYGDDIEAPVTTPTNPYAPVGGRVTQAMRDRAADILGNWKKNGVPENELYSAINQDTLPDKIKSLKEVVDGGAYEKRMKELFGTTDIKKADIGKVVDYIYNTEPARAENIKNTLLAERGLGKNEQKFRNRMKKGLYEAAQERIAKDVGANGLASSKNIADISIRQGYTAAADEALSERLGIAPGNTPKYNGAMDTRNAFGRYSHPSYREGGDLAVFERKMSSPEDAISTVAHERLHSFQGELEPRNKGRYDKEILEAYGQLRSDLAPHYKSWDETAERYGHSGTDYWQSIDEQESRMLQNYLENKGYTDSTHMKSKYRTGEWGSEINPAFDKFFDKLRDLSKRGVALPALTALFGGGALMANQQKDKEEVK